MMKLLKKRSLLLHLVLLLLIASILISSAFAWFALGDGVGRVEYSIAKINSSVTLHKANDDNKNGAPNLLDTPVSQPYYTEKYEFEKLGGEVFALSESSEANVLTSISIEDAMPSDVYTFKYSLVNKSTADNLITFRLAAGEYSGAALLSTLSVRIGKVVADENGNGKVEYHGKYYLCDYLTDGETITDVENFEDIALLDSSENVFIAKMDEAEDKDNYLDFWIQIEMESYEALSLRNNFNMSYEDYQALEGVSAALPMLYIYFEIVYDG